MSTSFSDIFNDHIAIAFDKQLDFADLVGAQHSWGYDAETRRLTIDDFSWNAEIIGTESTSSSTWLWIWANQSAKDQLDAKALPLVLKESFSGSIAELVTPKLQLTDSFTGHMLAAAATGILKADAYYRGEYDGGAAYILVSDPEYPKIKHEPRSRILSVFPRVLGEFECDHARALGAYAGYYGFKVEGDRKAMRLTDREGKVMRAAFDPLGRILELEAL